VLIAQTVRARRPLSTPPGARWRRRPPRRWRCAGQGQAPEGRGVIHSRPERRVRRAGRRARTQAGTVTTGTGPSLAGSRRCGGEDRGGGWNRVGWSPHRRSAAAGRTRRGGAGSLGRGGPCERGRAGGRAGWADAVIDASNIPSTSTEQARAFFATAARRSNAAKVRREGGNPSRDGQPPVTCVAEGHRDPQAGRWPPRRP
jgi:hypothetical protein